MTRTERAHELSLEHTSEHPNPRGQSHFIARLVRRGILCPLLCPNSMQDFLTITEAIAFTKKSKSTIRRFVNAVVSNPQDKRRDDIRPSPDEVERFKAEKQPFQWLIRRELLQQLFLDQPAAQQPMHGSPVADANGTRLLTILDHELAIKEKHLSEIMRQLTVKDDQIARLNNSVDSLNERLREGNVLIGTLQQRLALAAPSQPATSVVVDSPVHSSEPQTMQGHSSKKTATAAQRRSKTPPIKKRSWFRFF